MRATGDVERLRDSVAPAEEVDHATIVAVAALRRVGYAWAELANRTRHHPSGGPTALEGHCRRLTLLTARPGQRPTE
jgi:hypothetical protein